LGEVDDHGIEGSTSIAYWIMLDDVTKHQIVGRGPVSGRRVAIGAPPSGNTKRARLAGSLRLTALASDFHVRGTTVKLEIPELRPEATRSARPRWGCPS